MASKNYRDLLVWQKAMDFAAATYHLTQRLPADERFCLTSQLRRSATSVPSNIAEGQGRFSNPDFKRFLSIAHGSLSEAETQILLAIRLNYLQKEDAQAALDLAVEIGKMIHGLAKTLN